MLDSLFDGLISGDCECYLFPLRERIIIAIAITTLLIVLIILARTFRLSPSSEKKVKDEHKFSSTYTMVTILESENGEDYEDDEDDSVLCEK